MVGPTAATQPSRAVQSCSEWVSTVAEFLLTYKKRAMQGIFHRSCDPFDPLLPPPKKQLQNLNA